MTMDQLGKLGKTSTQLKKVSDALGYVKAAVSELDPELQAKLLYQLCTVEERPEYLIVSPGFLIEFPKHDCLGNEISVDNHLEYLLLALDTRIRDLMLQEKIEATGKVRYIEDTRTIFEDILGDEQTKKEG